MFSQGYRLGLCLAGLMLLTGCHGRQRVASSTDSGGLVSVRTQNGVQVRAPFVNVNVPTRAATEISQDAPELVPPSEFGLPN